MIDCIITKYGSTLLQGIIASLLAVIIWEICRFFINYIDKFRLKAVLGVKNRNCLIITNIRHRNTDEELVHYKNSYALGHIIEIVNKIKKISQVIPYHKLSEFNEVSDVISIGGPLSNDYTKKILTDYRIEYNTTKQNEINKYSTPIANEIVTGFKIKGNDYPAEDHREPALILKLTDKETSQDRSIVLIMGLTPQATAAASYFLSKEYKSLYRKYKSKMFYILIYNSSRESYKVYEKKFIDLTPSTFKQ
jgi:hypothetical protein